MKWIWTMALAVVTGCSTGPEPGPWKLTPCHISGLSEPVECYALDVPVDYDRPGGDVVTLGGVIVRARSARPEPDPLVVLPGGPGQAASEMGALIPAAFDRVHARRDIVLFDPRGTGRTTPLRCAPETALHKQTTDEAMARLVARCATDAEMDVSFMTSNELIEDLERVRRALGAEKWSIWGGSFGTRAAQHYLRRYPERARRVVLDAFIPAGVPLLESAPATAQRAFDRLFEACAEDEACSRRYPDLASRLTVLLRELGSGREVQYSDPRSGAPMSAHVDRDTFAQVLRGALYAPLYASVIPWAIVEAERGNFAPIAALAAQTAAWSAETMYFGATLGILCSESVHRVDGEALKAKAKHWVTADSYYRGWSQACDAWPGRPVSDWFAEPVSVDAPVLFLSGALDPITPPSLVADVLINFPRATHVIAPAASHTISTHPCVPELIADFLDGADAKLETACVERGRRPGFYLGSGGGS